MRGTVGALVGEKKLRQRTETKVPIDLQPAEDVRRRLVEPHAHGAVFKPNLLTVELQLPQQVGGVGLRGVGVIRRTGGIVRVVVILVVGHLVVVPDDHPGEILQRGAQVRVAAVGLVERAVVVQP